MSRVHPWPGRTSWGVKEAPPALGRAVRAARAREAAYGSAERQRKIRMSAAVTARSVTRIGSIEELCAAVGTCTVPSSGSETKRWPPQQVHERPDG
eukprot:scaffold103830_cov57-Phaeocystis_antarctica.AAC.1